MSGDPKYAQIPQLVAARYARFCAASCCHLLFRRGEQYGPEVKRYLLTGDPGLRSYAGDIVSSAPDHVGRAFAALQSIYHALQATDAVGDVYRARSRMGAAVRLAEDHAILSIRSEPGAAPYAPETGARATMRARLRLELRVFQEAGIELSRSGGAYRGLVDAPREYRAILRERAIDLRLPHLAASLFHGASLDFDPDEYRRMYSIGESAFTG